jgi:hypothetical protein
LRLQSLPPSPRRGVILLVVFSLLTLFALVGLSFVLYADAEAKSSQLFREAGVHNQPDLDPQLLLAYFLGQLVCDVDDQAGIYSALRGHSLVRLLYGYNDQAGNATPFIGTGRLHGPSPIPGVDDYQLVNYTYFPADGFLRDPERLGWRAGPAQPRGPFAGGFNVPYTYPDLNNMFLAAMRADGTVLIPSFHRPWLFGPLTDPNNPNWSNRHGKYLTLRPREFDQRLNPQVPSRFPYPEDEGGDVKNLIGAPGGNDSVWLDLGAPVRSTPDGRKFKPLFAPLIIDLDNRVNVNVHGNVRGTGASHVSNQGWGPWEVNLGHVLAGNNEWRNLFIGTPAPRQHGRYGIDRLPGSLGSVVPYDQTPHFYGPVDFDGCNDNRTPTDPLVLPGLGAPAFSCFPAFPAGYGNGSPAEASEHPLFSSAVPLVGDDRAFDLSNMEALLRYGDTGSPALTSELFRLCPACFQNPRIRRLVTTESYDFEKPGVTPWVWNPVAFPYQVQVPGQAPQGPPIPFPSLAPGTVLPAGEFGPDGRALTPVSRIDLSRKLTSYPLAVNQTPVTYNQRFDVDPLAARFLQAQQERQNLAQEIYRRLLLVTGVAPAANPAAPTDADLMPRRWLAQLAANIVDFIDEDDLSTPFNFYSPLDGLPAALIGTFSPSGNPPVGDPELPRYWVFGTELPHLVVNEVLAEYQEPALPTPGATYPVKVWVELHNPFQVPPAGVKVQPQAGFPVPLQVAALPGGVPSVSASGKATGYAPYQVVIANRLAPQPGNNDNVLGKPEQVRTQTSDGDFAGPVSTLGGPPQPSAGVAPQGFFLLGPPGDDANGAVAAPPTGTVPAGTPLLRSPSLEHPVTYAGPPARTPDDRTSGVSVFLRRLANPHIPFDPNPTVPAAAGMVQPNPWYNPYLTVDYLEGIPLTNMTAPGTPAASLGKRQPYASLPHVTQVAPQVAGDAGKSTQHTFGRQNDPPPLGANPHYDWLVHLDRRLISPMELLHVSGYPPHQLTHRFMLEQVKFQHRVPWFDPTRRLYRLFEFLQTHPLAAETVVGSRAAGKINLNTVWDLETFLALCDPQSSNGFTADDVTQIFQNLVSLRTPGGVPGPTDKPFLSLATGEYPLEDTQFRNYGIDHTVLRPHDGSKLPNARRLFEVPFGNTQLFTTHPYRRFELLTKIFNQVTTRSNVFAVWLTVGFFEVTDDASRPVKLGAEIGRAENRHLRHRLFALVDRSLLSANTGPPARFDPRGATAAVGAPWVVRYYSIID